MEVDLIVGKRKSGKTILAKALAWEHLRRNLTLTHVHIFTEYDSKYVEYQDFITICLRTRPDLIFSNTVLHFQHVDLTLFPPHTLFIADDCYGLVHDLTLTDPTSVFILTQYLLRLVPQYICHRVSVIIDVQTKMGRAQRDNDSVENTMEKYRECLNSRAAVKLTHMRILPAISVNNYWFLEGCHYLGMHWR